MKRPWRLHVKDGKHLECLSGFWCEQRGRWWCPSPRQWKRGKHQVGLGSMVTSALTWQMQTWIKNGIHHLEELLDFLNESVDSAYFKALATKHSPDLRSRSFFLTSERHPASLCHPKIKGFDRFLLIAASLSRPWGSQKSLPWGSLRTPSINKGKPKTNNMAGTLLGPLLTFRCHRNNRGQESDRWERRGRITYHLENINRTYFILLGYWGL